MPLSSSVFAHCVIRFKLLATREHRNIRRHQAMWIDPPSRIRQAVHATGSAGSAAFQWSASLRNSCDNPFKRQKKSPPLKGHISLRHSARSFIEPFREPQAVD